jgi:hypothetical protein
LFISKKILARKCNISLDSLNQLIQSSIFDEDELVNTYLVELYGLNEPNYDVGIMPWMLFITVIETKQIKVSRSEMSISFEENLSDSTDPMSLSINIVNNSIELWDGYSNHSIEEFNTKSDFIQGMKTLTRKFIKLLN